jgi:hypothetical protein
MGTIGIAFNAKLRDNAVIVKTILIVRIGAGETPCGG